MKRFYSLIITAVTLLCAVSCVQELSNTAENPEGAVVYKAIAEAAVSRAVLGTNESGRPQSMWEDGDKIYIATGNGMSYLFSTSLESPSPVAHFTTRSSVDLSEVSAVIASYPANLLWGDPLYLSQLSIIPTVQYVRYDLESYDRNAVPAIAYSKNRTLNFNNVSSLLKFKVNLDGVSKIRFSALGGEYIAGGIIVMFDEDGSLSFVGPDNGMVQEPQTHYVELLTQSGDEFQADRTYYMSVIPNTLESGFVLELLDANDSPVYTKEYDRSITIKRNVILDLGTLGEGSSEKNADYIDEYGINHGPGVEINGVVWAPVNCGYHETDFKWGKLYQWGRKYGQGYIGGSFADAVLPELKTAPVALAEGQAAENENVFFNYNMLDGYRDNWSDGVQSGLWNSGTELNPIKTEYDPCPNGWRVPTSTEMSSLESVTYSWIRESQPAYNGVYGTVVTDVSGLREAFFPASGYLSSSNASGIDRGRYHSYWTSNYNDVYHGVEIGLIFGGPYSEYQSSAFGYSVRCVQDESPLIKVESLTISTTSVSMTQGETCTISAEVFPSDANQSSALWYSDTPSVATVDKDGNIKALSAGTAKIIAMAGMKVAECEVAVKVSPFVGTWNGSIFGMYRMAQYQDVKFTVTADPEDGMTVSAGINPYFTMNGIDQAKYKASVEGNQLVVYAEQPVGYGDVILLGFNHADPNKATAYDNIRFVMNDDGVLTQLYAFGAYTASQGGWYEIYPGGGTFVKDQNAIEDMPKIEL